MAGARGLSSQSSCPKNEGAAENYEEHPRELPAVVQYLSEDEPIGGGLGRRQHLVSGRDPEPSSAQVGSPVHDSGKAEGDEGEAEKAGHGRAPLLRNVGRGLCLVQAVCEL